MTDTETTTDELATVETFMRDAGITYRMLDYWTTQGHLIAVAEQNPGSGAHRQWEQRELDIACVMVRLREADMPLSLAARLAREHVELTENTAPTTHEIVPGIKIEIWPTDV
ncbi:MAG: MerR family transcriptional regulator [Ilumatobacteraceae bacterium]